MLQIQSSKEHIQPEYRLWSYLSGGWWTYYIWRQGRTSFTFMDLVSALQYDVLCTRVYSLNRRNSKITWITIYPSPLCLIAQYRHCYWVAIKLIQLINTKEILVSYWIKCYSFFLWHLSVRLTFSSQFFSHFQIIKKIVTRCWQPTHALESTLFEFKLKMLL